MPPVTGDGMLVINPPNFPKIPRIMANTAAIRITEGSYTLVTDVYKRQPFPDPLPDQPFQLCLQKLIGILGDGVMGNDFQHAVQILFLIS